MQKTALLILVMVMSFLTSCKEFKDITVSDVDSFFINKVTAEGIEAEIKLKIKNPNPNGFSIYPSEFDVSFSGIRLGKAKLHKRVHIDANSERVYTFQLKSGLGDLNLFDALKLLNTDNLGKIDVQGDLKAGKFYIKKKFPVAYTDKIKIFK